MGNPENHVNNAHLGSLALAGLLTAAACRGEDEPETTPTDTHETHETHETTDDPVDADQDGFSVEDGDCDDFNNTIYPGAPERADDAIDQDCDGFDLEGPGDPDPSDVDDDGDGYTENDGDCDDDHHGVYPGARESSYDDLDTDCDGENAPALSDNLFEDWLAVFDTNSDGAISVDEFDAQCANSAMVEGVAEPGVVHVQVACGYTSLCRGMVYHEWEELLEHDCAGVNYCAGFSCVETAPDQGRDAETLFTEAACDWCHTGSGPDAFKVKVPPGEDVDTFVATFLDRTDAELRNAIAFGIQGQHEGQAYRNMPSHYEVMSRAEMDTLVAWIRTATLEGEAFEYPESP